MKVSVAKKAPKKGMQLGKPKNKKKANPLMADLQESTDPAKAEEPPAESQEEAKQES